MRIFLILLSLTIMTTGKLFAEKNRKKEKDQIYKSFIFKGFDEISIGYKSRVEVRFSKKYSIEITASEEEMKRIDLDLEGDKLVLKRKKKWDELGSEEIGIRITLPLLEELALAGSNTLRIRDMKQEKFKLELAGSTEVDIEAVLSECELNIAGSCDLKLSGESESLVINSAGSSDLEALGFEVKTLELNIAGYSNAKVNVNEKMDVNIAGGGKIRYIGNPELNLDKVGFGSVKKLKMD